MNKHIIFSLLTITAIAYGSEKEKTPTDQPATSYIIKSQKTEHSKPNPAEAIQHVLGIRENPAEKTITLPRLFAVDRKKGQSKL